MSNIIITICLFPGHLMLPCLCALPAPKFPLELISVVCHPHCRVGRDGVAAHLCCGLCFAAGTGFGEAAVPLGQEEAARCANPDRTALI